MGKDEMGLEGNIKDGASKSDASLLQSNASPSQSNALCLTHGGSQLQVHHNIQDWANPLLAPLLHPPDIAQTASIQPLFPLFGSYQGLALSMFNTNSGYSNPYNMAGSFSNAGAGIYNYANVGTPFTQNGGMFSFPDPMQGAGTQSTSDQWNLDGLNFSSIDYPPLSSEHLTAHISSMGDDELGSVMDEPRLLAPPPMSPPEEHPASPQIPKARASAQNTRPKPRHDVGSEQATPSVSTDMHLPKKALPKKASSQTVPINNGNPPKATSKAPMALAPKVTPKELEAPSKKVTTKGVHSKTTTPPKDAPPLKHTAHAKKITPPKMTAHATKLTPLRPMTCSQIKYLSKESIRGRWAQQKESCWESDKEEKGQVTSLGDIWSIFLSASLALYLIVSGYYIALSSGMRDLGTCGNFT
ncbi:hypothetical protein PAXRUDRAFT_28263 [Paxillus rubicundulus Ve08.2h10]|uniref:Uncharacterized protein n=1 Tax=Paxillus rubicundulus Ve08.2h10 TaxID=930991 RepID=A0A0D0DFX3_9AGAM|nr:hypothetical protein PAXRUDRAFT_28263 [Paxillus rubicundulus Ve08.2h10]